MCEEYDERTDQLMVRKWRRKSQLGGVKEWEVEVGEPPRLPPVLQMGKELLVESNANPICNRYDTKRSFLWRIRNLPYPKNVYQVTVDEERRMIVIRTSNKKYFKKLYVSDMERCGLKLSQDKISYSHANNTLVIQYEKPPQVLTDEDVLVRELKSMKMSGDGDADCKQS